ncbi:class I SAM-dependent methyltransferase [Conexibacter sp. JD483]|uniref:class I SAM-dependent methyltransferase n=1 Tax=unclassified Conexibacter TaxID=2627773 RepID=UPI00271F7171|nr:MULTISPECIES: class I SAM-dependent methyltransferase [unclassified Conexibacter]MDO8186223.1 class I SAM-dependent methyltransferase [Conexibacter sp. CPCC 205706]MDO8199710.1 class I SAM-dependent methyltransferase [Conexibacter sp. CPCC 205762]MDR9368198.1 class I SAM-dependent methyltransferase [Conexibacter sp. JD483]
MSDEVENLNELDAFGAAFIAMSDKLGRYEETEQECREIATLLSLAPGARVLDAGCGFGRSVGALSRLGYDAVGVDISPAVIGEAERRNPGPSYLVHDLTRPLPAEVERFDAIVNLYSSFGYGVTRADDQLVLDTWHAALKPGGKLVMELSDIERTLHRLGPLGTVVDREDNGVHEHLYVDPETRVLHVTYTAEGRSIEVETRYYTAEELQAMVEQAGFSEVARYGGFDGHPKQPDDRLVLVATA